MRFVTVSILLASASRILHASPIPLQQRSSNEQSTTTSASLSHSSLAPKPKPSLAHNIHAHSNAEKQHESSSGSDIILPVALSVGGTLALLTVGGIAYWRYNTAKTAAEAAKAAISAKQSNALSDAWEAYDNEIYKSLNDKYNALYQDYVNKFEPSAYGEEGDFAKYAKEIGERHAADLNSYYGQMMVRDVESSPPVEGSAAYLRDHASDLYTRYPEIATVDNYYNKGLHAQLKPEFKSIESEVQFTSPEDRLANLIAKNVENPKLVLKEQTMLYHTVQNAKLAKLVKEQGEPQAEAVQATIAEGFEEGWKGYASQQRERIFNKFDKLKSDISAMQERGSYYLEDVVEAEQYADIQDWIYEVAQRKAKGQLPVSMYMSDQSFVLYDVAEVRAETVESMKKKAESLEQHIKSTGKSVEEALVSDEYVQAAEAADKELTGRIASVIKALPNDAASNTYRNVWQAVVNRQQGVLTSTADSASGLSGYTDPIPTTTGVYDELSQTLEGQVAEEVEGNGKVLLEGGQDLSTVTKDLEYWDKQIATTTGQDLEGKIFEIVAQAA